jgi:hypothetical protein
MQGCLQSENSCHRQLWYYSGFINGDDSETDQNIRDTLKVEIISKP